LRDKWYDFRVVRFPTRLGLFVLFLHAVTAQTQPEVAEILKKVGDVYKPLSQYEFEIDVAFTEGKKTVTTHVRFAFKAPDKYRMEGELPGLADPGSDLDGGAIVVDDGANFWIYLPRPSKYASIPASALTPGAPGDLGDVRPEVMDYGMTWRYRAASDFAGNSKLLREESVTTAARKVDCYVLAVLPEKRGPTYTWWVDKTTYRILREDDAGNTSLFTSIKLNEPIPDAVFRFEPPPGAQKFELR
jgi:outer membrane lipoprotein-sorting protein